VIALRLRRFWPGASRDGAFFSRLVASALDDRVRLVGSSSAADLEIVSGQVSSVAALRSRATAAILHPRSDVRWADQKLVRPGHRRSIWYTGENIRPPATDSWSGFLSFDLDPLGGRNAYLPLWQVDLSDFTAYGTLTIESLLSPRDVELDRPGFVCAFIGNPEATRIHALEALRALGPVDVFGKSVGRPVVDKITLAQHYRYVLSFENDLYPGYVTEKALDGSRTGCILLYRGLDSGHYLNSSSMVNLAELRDIESLVRRVEELELHEDERAELLKSPVLTRAPDLEPAMDLIRRVMND